MKRQRILALILVLAMVMSVLAGCAGNGNTTGSSDVTPSTSAKPQPSTGGNEPEPTAPSSSTKPESPEPDVPTVNYTVSFSDGVQSQTVASGKLATKPADPVKEGHKFLGWYNGDVAFDFSTPITADISLTAKWEEVNMDMWYDFSDSSSANVWSSNNATLEWLESYEGAEGVLHIKANGGTTFIGDSSAKVNWATALDKENCAGAIALKFRIFVPGNGVFHSFNMWTGDDQLPHLVCGDQLATNGWKEFDCVIDVNERYAGLQTMYLTLWASGVTDFYIDEITVVRETEKPDPEPTPDVPADVWYDFSDSSSADVALGGNGITVEWLESFQGAEGVLKLQTGNGGYSGTVGAPGGKLNWEPAHSKETYAGAVGLKFRAWMEGDFPTALILYPGRDDYKWEFTLSGNGQGAWFECEFSSTNVEDNKIDIDFWYDMIKNMYFWFWTENPVTVYIDQITVVR